MNGEAKNLIFDCINPRYVLLYTRKQGSKEVQWIRLGGIRHSAEQQNGN